MQQRWLGISRVNAPSHFIVLLAAHLSHLLSFDPSIQRDKLDKLVLDTHQSLSVMLQAARRLCQANRVAAAGRRLLSSSISATSAIPSNDVTVMLITRVWPEPSASAASVRDYSLLEIMSNAAQWLHDDPTTPSENSAGSSTTNDSNNSGGYSSSSSGGTTRLVVASAAKDSPHREAISATLYDLDTRSRTKLLMLTQYLDASNDTD